jgi:PP-loop superfamily ATP-utilizing enzyme
MLPGRRVVWFSCGAASAVAAMMAVHKYGKDVEVVYCNTLTDEHNDNLRFLHDVEDWLSIHVKIISSKKYANCEEVWEDKKYMSGIAGAPCTVELKKIPRFAYQYPEDVHIFGMTVDESARIDRFAHNNHDLFLEWPLRDNNINKQDCYDIIKKAGIKLPEMYTLGFDNNNCIGCVKAQSPHYWNRVRVNFPETFKRRAEQSRRLGAKLVRLKGVRIFLDELPTEATEVVIEDLSCGPQCSPQEIKS